MSTLTAIIASPLAMLDPAQRVPVLRIIIDYGPMWPTGGLVAVGIVWWWYAQLRGRL